MRFKHMHLNREMCAQRRCHHYCTGENTTIFPRDITHCMADDIDCAATFCRMCTPGSSAPYIKVCPSLIITFLNQFTSQALYASQLLGSISVLSGLASRPIPIPI
ncbi:hypothetical protein B0O99DRAFT_632106 [Bisporella sp. PMI_857]|nr:hypothetical protein B0O99DRAFT_632106 [Bisporella sp. PMI_857]